MITRAFIVLFASVGPLAFPFAQLGYATLHDLAVVALLPSVAALAAAWLALRHRRPDVADIVARGAAAGAIATLALEAFRYPGFRLGFMPGNLPRLMGVLLLDRFALGPSAWSDLAGFAFHARGLRWDAGRSPRPSGQYLRSHLTPFAVGGITGAVRYGCAITMRDSFMKAVTDVAEGYRIATCPSFQ